jgi:NAD dependent epimerase/dehydratase
MNWKGVRVGITGAAGFIGSHLTEELACRGAKVRAMFRYNSRNHWGHLEDAPEELRPNIEMFPGDITDPFLVDKFVQGQEVVFHLSSLIAIPFSYAAPASYVTVNVQGALNVLEACKRHKTRRLVHTSTSETYGTALYAPIDEEHPLQGQSPYSASKIAADKLAESYYRSFDLPVATIRPFNTYGPRQSARAVIPTLITQGLSVNGKVSLGDLRPVRDFTFVSDTVEGFIKVAESDEAVGKVTNIGSGSGLTIGELAKKVLKLMGSEAKVVGDEQRVRPAKSEVFKLIASNKRARKLGWKPKVGMEQGLKTTIDYLSRNLHRYKPSMYNV